VTAPEPAWRWTPEEVRELGRAVVDLVAEHLCDLPEGPAFRPFPVAEATAMAAEPVPDRGAPAAEVLADVRRRVLPYPFGNGHPRFSAWVNPPPHLLGVLAEAVAAAMNPSVAGGNHAAVHVERQVVRWFADLAGLPPGSGGLLVSGGSTATLTAFATARHRAAARAGTDVRADGLQGHDRRFVLYLGAEGHGSARKAAELLGLGSRHVRLVPADGQGRMRPDLLRAAVERDLAAGEVPVAVMASAGTVNTGAVDPLDEIADVCRDLGVWLHVDGAYGAPALLLLDRYAGHRPGLARADSIALDPHKWLYAPVDAGLLLLREPAAARDAFSLVPDYLRTDGDPTGVGGPVWFSEFGFEQTRPFRALKVWMLLRHLGLAGYRELVAHDVAVAERLADGVRAAPDLELLAAGLSVVCFRYRPPGLDDPQRLDALDGAVLTAVQLGGRAFVGGTTVDGATALRACVVNPRTGGADVDAVLADVRAAGARLAAATG
jgi:glutamate/tyrosine decarboxylase-like PLP-dependent enzyme